MMSLGSYLLVLAAAEGAKPNGMFDVMGPPFLIIIALYFVMVIFPQQGERKKRAQLMENLKKNDRVVTKSGIIGTVANFSGDGKEITLKVDDNCRIRFLRSAIETVLIDEAGTNSDTK